MLIQALSFVQVQWTALCNAINECRRKYVVPLALQGGRDMVLLRSGGWVDASPSIPESVIESRYIAVEHRVRIPGDDMPYFHRCPYLSVADAEHDMTDFFIGLKLSNDYMLSDSEFMTLYAHQTQQFPVGPIQLLMRDLSEKTLDESFQEITEEEEEEGQEEEEEEEEEQEQEQEQEEEQEDSDRSVSPISPVNSADDDRDNGQKDIDEVADQSEAPASPVEEDHANLIQSIRLVDDVNSGISRIESNVSITSTQSEPICGSNLDYVK